MEKNKAEGKKKTQSRLMPLRDVRPTENKLTKSIG